MGCVPAASAERVKAAVPGLPLSFPVPIDTPLSRKLTVPVAGDVAAEVTVAVKVTGRPYVDGFRLEETAIDDDACTSWKTAGEVLPST